MLISLARMSLVFSLVGLPMVSACSSDDGGGDSESFATFEDCFIDHSQEESLPIDKAIAVCCLDHPIGGAEAGMVCGPTAATCTDYVSGELSTDEATNDEIDTGCGEYESQM
ncbi:MAG TPA: hypothetical protein VGC41_08325 [Kofleriaceae bacterium]